MDGFRLVEVFAVNCQHLADMGARLCQDTAGLGAVCLGCFGSAVGRKVFYNAGEWRDRL